MGTLGVREVKLAQGQFAHNDLCQFKNGKGHSLGFH